MLASDEAAERGWLRRLGLFVHLLMCDKCRRYKAQIEKLGQAARELWQPPADATITRLRDSILGGDNRDER